MLEDAKKMVNRLVSDYYKWIEKNGSLEQREIEYIQSDLADRSLHGLNLILDSLKFISTSKATFGVTKLLSQDKTGWDDIHLAAAYQIKYLKVKTTIFLKTQSLSNVQRTATLEELSSLAANILCYAIVFGCNEAEREAMNALQIIMNEPNATKDGYWASRSYEPFVLQLFALEKSPNSIHPPSNNYGVYDNILNNCFCEDGFEKDIDLICDYHCSNTTYNESKLFSEFADRPFELLPIEVMAIYRIRERRELINPIRSHALLNDVFFNYDLNYAGPTDKILTSVNELYSEVFGN